MEGSFRADRTIQFTGKKYVCVCDLRWMCTFIVSIMRTNVGQIILDTYWTNAHQSSKKTSFQSGIRHSEGKKNIWAVEKK